jgi:hypothetical protein
MFYDNYFIIFAWFSLTIPILGVPGNLGLFLIYSTKSLRKLSISIYFRSIAIFNLFICIFWINIILDYVYDINIVNSSNFWCKFAWFTIYVPIVGWIEAAINLDRMRTIIFRRKFLFTTTHTFQLALVSLIVLYNSAYYLIAAIAPRVRTLYVNSTTTGHYALADDDYYVSNISSIITKNTTLVMHVCYMPYYYIYNYMDLPNATLLPFLVKIIASILTVVFIVKKRKQMHAKNSIWSQQRRRDRKFAITVIAMDVVFIVMTMPYNILFLINFWKPVISILLLVFNWLNNSYYAINFYLQFAVNNLVRKETEIFQKSK